MSGIGRGDTGIPKAMIHRKVLDVATTNPEASHAELATQISGASPDLVKRVLDTYGDPVENEEEETATTSITASEPLVPSHTGNSTTEDECVNPGDTDQMASSPGEDQQNSMKSYDKVGSEGDSNEYTAENDRLEKADERSMDNLEETPGEQTAQTAGVDSNSEATERAERSTTDLDPETSTELSESEPPSVADLTEKQRQTLRAIQANPAATQAEIASEFDVTPATVNAHVNAVQGFDWSERATFVNNLFNDEPTPETNCTDDSERHEEQPTMSSQHAETQFDEIEARLTEISDRLEATKETTDPLSAELTHKIIHACMESEQITTDEELQIIRSLLN